MPDVLILGDGPGGLSAALLLAKNGLEAVVLGPDETPMHRAMLYNYLGIPEMTGSEFQRVARDHASSHGARLVDGEAAAVERTESGFAATTAEGDRFEASTLILAGGPKKPFAEDLGAETDERGGIRVDREGRTSVPGLYAIGWGTRLKQIQAIISAGDGAAAALSILSERAGKEVHDFDLVEE